MIEYLQNLPILLGLFFALHSNLLYASLFYLMAGSLLTAFLIYETEHIKLPIARDTPTQFIKNIAAFATASVLFYLYWHAIRLNMPVSPIVDIILGLVFGFIGGLIQGIGSNEWRKRHTISLMAAGAVIFLLINMLQSFHPVIAALLLDGPMTLMICFIDYPYIFKFSK
ncbi:hypothetical protein Lery_1064 [Legionella erythra]|uniref:Transmembrane protein n=2 Tax=Legionella erythra TaxID=448 RepID=A0A0W0TRD0_LEGER|nr:hypothetical protein [Legionella erythra]KTC98010.1 hypothetical protein Lery_1064 [Legionella erythra]